MKNSKTIIAILAVALCTAVLTTATRAQQEKCPPNSRCLYFEGEDSIRTAVTISNGAASLLQKWNIRLTNNGTKLVWITSRCQDNTDSCANVDLTGRHPTEIVSQNDLNKKVTMTAVGTDTVKITFEEFDGDEGQYLIKRGIWHKK